ncbi:tigger transposable element-derived protein [Plakobranchus ocellatus]|uniref:Tigger transposable element-derived protein n=1 Tax=Plakobranchus ocellatus TaxID=259542 RepID=A0AAV3YPV0_9GAST|nr:tigger transposable element-derived protein [Plakobranchus ocellatus]
MNGVRPSQCVVSPHCSHKLQPLDRTIYGPMKKFYYTACNEWMYQNPGQRMTIYDVAGLVGKAYPKAFTSTNILSGFRNTGISPLDVNVFSEDDFVQSFVTDQAAPPVQDVPSRDSGAPLVQPEDPGTSSAATLILPEESRSASGVGKDEDLPTVEQQTNHEASRFENTTAQLEQREINLEKAAFSSCSPEVLWPHPKAERRTCKTRRLGKTRILIDTPEKNASDAHRSEMPVSVEEPLSSRPTADHLTTDMPLPATADDQVDGADMNGMNDSVLEKKDISKTYLCIFCQENFQHSRPGDVWIQCQTCENWCHEECADIRSGCYFTCDL